MRIRHLTRQQVPHGQLSSSDTLLYSSSKYLLSTSYGLGPELDAVVQTEKPRQGL